MDPIESALFTIFILCTLEFNEADTVGASGFKNKRKALILVYER